MNTTPIIMDGITYNVRIKADPGMEESFRIDDGPNSGTSLAGTEIPDIMGTYYDHTFTVERNPAYPDDYDKFFLAISAPVESHTFVLPHGQGTITYKARVKSGAHTYVGILGGRRIYKNLQVSVQTVAPQRVPE